MRGFILHFLKAHDINTHSIRFLDYPAGSGCGEYFVKKEYAKEVEYLKRNSFRRIVLVVCTDADRLSCEDRIKMLESEVETEYKDWSYLKERVIMWIPKREIETWIHFLQGEDTDESVEYRHSGKPEKCKEESIKMMYYCRDLLDLDTLNVPSLRNAKDEYIRVCLLQGKELL